MVTRRKFTSKFKVKVVLEALREKSTMAELAQKYELAPAQISQWKREFLDSAEKVFEEPTKDKKSVEQEERYRLLKTIGEQKVHIDFLTEALR